MYDKEVAHLPDGFVPYEQWSEFDLENNFLPHVHTKVVGSNPRGARSGRWSIYFEEYVSDQEPAASQMHDPLAPPRLLVWRRVSRTDVPQGWWQWGWRSLRLEGFADLETSSDYASLWSESAKRYRRKWLAQTAATIEFVSFEEFCKYYRQSSVPPWVQTNYIDIAGRMLKGPGLQHIEIMGVRDNHTHRLLAGMITVNSPSCRASYYLCGFISPEATEVPAMVGLIDHWYKTGQERGYKFLHFGEFWLPGKPDHWKGFSSFKKKFGLSYITYPPILVRPKGGKLLL